MVRSDSLKRNHQTLFPSGELLLFMEQTPTMYLQGTLTITMSTGSSEIEYYFSFFNSLFSKKKLYSILMNTFRILFVLRSLNLELNSQKMQM